MKPSRPTACDRLDALPADVRGPLLTLLRGAGEHAAQYGK